MRPFKWMWPYIRDYKWHYVLGLLGSTLFIVTAFVNPYVGGLIAKEVFDLGNYDALPILVLVMLGSTLAKSVIRYFNLLLFENTSQTIIKNIRHDIYVRVQDQSFSFFDTNKVGDIMARMTGDLDAIKHFIAHVIYALYENVVFFIVGLIMCFAISWQLTLAMLVVAPGIAYFTIILSKKTRPVYSVIRDLFSKLNSVCQENISGNRVVKAFTREEYEIEKFTRENEAYAQANVDAGIVWIKYYKWQDILAGLMGVIMILFGGLLVIYDKLELYQLLIINGYVWAINGPMRSLGWLIGDVQRFVASLDKIYGMMRTKIDIVNPKNGVKTDRLIGAIEFKNVSFSYDKFKRKNMALKNVSFKAEAGHTVGIVGPTGSGKSTLINLISRYYDVSEGKVLVDGIDVTDYDLTSLRRDISYAMQDVFLFSDTIEGNIAYGVPEADMQTLYDAAESADADNFIKKTVDGYDTIIGERGVGLSGGQKQRLSLARAIATKPSVLILDDTTSAVDMETEHKIQTALDEKYAGCTKFIIAHRISSVRNANLILVLVDGEVIEKGTHEELVEKKGYYYDLFVNQYSDFEEMLGKKPSLKTSVGQVLAAEGGVN